MDRYPEGVEDGFRRRLSYMARLLSNPDELDESLRALLKIGDLDGGWAFHLRAAYPDGVQK